MERNTIFSNVKPNTPLSSLDPNEMERKERKGGKRGGEKIPFSRPKYEQNPLFLGELAETARHRAFFYCLNRDTHILVFGPARAMKQEDSYKWAYVVFIRHKQGYNPSKFATTQLRNGSLFVRNKTIPFLLVIENQGVIFCIKG